MYFFFFFFFFLETNNVSPSLLFHKYSGLHVLLRLNVTFKTKGVFVCVVMKLGRFIDQTDILTTNFYHLTCLWSI